MQTTSRRALRGRLPRRACRIRQNLGQSAAAKLLHRERMSLGHSPEASGSRAIRGMVLFAEAGPG